jgi:hypothetical protein
VCVGGDLVFAACHRPRCSSVLAAGMAAAPADQPVGSGVHGRGFDPAPEFSGDGAGACQTSKVVPGSHSVARAVYYVTASAWLYSSAARHRFCGGCMTCWHGFSDGPRLRKPPQYERLEALRAASKRTCGEPCPALRPKPLSSPRNAVSSNGSGFFASSPTASPLHSRGAGASRPSRCLALLLARYGERCRVLHPTSSYACRSPTSARMSISPRGCHGSTA